MTYQHTKPHRDEAYVNIGIRDRGLLRNAVETAAEKTKAASMADYLRRLIIDAVAHDLGVKPQTLIWREDDRAQQMREIERLEAEEARIKAERERLSAGLGIGRASRRR